MSLALNATEGPWRPLGILDRLAQVMESGRVIEPARPDDPLERRAIEAVQGGERQPFEYLVTKYMRRVVSIAWGIVRNSHDAEELAQEAFVRGFQSIGRFKSNEPFGPWIYRIVTNLALDVIKHRHRMRQEELTAAVPAARSDNADLRARSAEIGQRIDMAIERLPEMQRIVARLYLVEEFDHQEIASMTSLSEGTVRSHLSLARKRLRQELADLYGGDDE